jgi:hypothetical protein
MFRKRIITGLVAATLGPRTADKITAVVQTTTEEHEVKKERMYIGYYFKDGLGHNEKTVRPEEEPTQEDFVQTRDINNPPEKQVVNQGKPY